MSRESTLSTLLAAACLFLAAYYGRTQHVVDLAGGMPYDAGHYAALTRQIAAGTQVEAQAPFAYRLGLPFLVAELGNDVLSGYRALNLVFGGLNVLLLFGLLRRFSRSSARVWCLLLLFVMHPLGPVRFALFYPVHVDPPALSCQLLAFHLFLRRPVPDAAYCALASLLCFAGVFVRESVLLPFVALLGQHVLRAVARRGGLGPGAIRPICFAAVPVLAGLTGVWISLGIPRVTGTFGFASHAGMVFQRNLELPSIWLLAALTVFGPILALPLSAPRQSARFLAEHPWLGLHVLGVLVLSTFAGSHTDRLIFWAYPAVLVLVLHVWERGDLRAATILAPLLLASCLVHRSFAEIPGAAIDPLRNHPTASRPAHLSASGEYDPDTPGLHVLAPYGDGLNFAQTYAAYMSDASRRILLAQLVPALFLLVLGCRRSARDQSYSSR